MVMSSFSARERPGSNFSTVLASARYTVREASLSLRLANVSRTSCSSSMSTSVKMVMRSIKPSSRAYGEYRSNRALRYTVSRCPDGQRAWKRSRSIVSLATQLGGISMLWMGLPASPSFASSAPLFLAPVLATAALAAAISFATIGSSSASAAPTASEARSTSKYSHLAGEYRSYDNFDGGSGPCMLTQ
eukprot:scaffold3451_cov116-Isochrysis_galbana.AAC.5